VKKGLLLIALAAGMLLSLEAQVSTVAYEGFNYASGASLTGQNGGTGWTSAWANNYSAYGGHFIIGSPLTYSGVSAIGGSATWSSGGNGIAENDRTLTLQNSGVVYLQFLARLSSSGAGTPNMRLKNAGVLTGGIGGNGGTYAANVSILDNNLTAAANGSSSSSALLSNLNLMVVRIDYNNANTTLWVNPDISAFDYTNPGNTASAVFNGIAPAFNEIDLDARSGSFDEITVLSVASVPEPSTYALFGIGAIGMLLVLRRKKTA